MKNRIAEARKTFLQRQQEWSKIEREARQGTATAVTKRNGLPLKFTSGDAVAAYDAGIPADESVELLLYGDIIPGEIDSRSVMDALQACGRLPLDVRVNSQGGLVNEGMAIHAAFARYPGKVTMHVDGVAASIASVICMAGDEIKIADSALFMVHKARSFISGAAVDLLREAAALRKLDASIADIYARRTRNGAGAWLTAMAAETWYTASEAFAAGLADQITSTKRKSTGGAAENRITDAASSARRRRLQILDAETVNLQGCIHLNLFGTIHQDDCRIAEWRQLLTESPQANVELRIKSPGGNFMAASRLAGLLLEHYGTVTATIENAGSGASIVAISANHVRIERTGHIFVHCSEFNDGLCLSVDSGIRDKVDGFMRRVYALKTGLRENEVRILMGTGGTEMDAQLATKLGFVDSICA